ncbi:hypothetical protein D4R52_02465 [bacterium]|nr:MAG: hypothetical protein D4R52_02465 [bacterium]
MKNLLELTKGEDRGWRKYHPVPSEPVTTFNGKSSRRSKVVGDVDLVALRVQQFRTINVRREPQTVAPVVEVVARPTVFEFSPRHPYFTNILFAGARKSEIYEQRESLREDLRSRKFPVCGPVMVREFRYAF